MGKIEIIVEMTEKAASGLAYRNRLLFPIAWEEKEGIWSCTAGTLTLLLVESITIFSLHISISPPFCMWSSEPKSILNQKAKIHKCCCIIKKWVSKQNLKNNLLTRNQGNHMNIFKRAQNKHKCDSTVTEDIMAFLLL